MRTRFLYILIMCFYCTLTSAQEVSQADAAFLAEIDSMLKAAEEQQKLKIAINNASDKRLKRELGFDFESLAPLVGGIIVTWTEKDFIKHDGTFPEKSSVYRWTDYGVAGAPLAATWAMKMAGVKSRSKWNRFVTANAMSMAFTFGASKAVKSFVDERRPDGSDEKSFPSGHASFAFASATILAREYGYLSPWIPVSGYACASATQMLRVKHNKHWMNDLYIGAGIGMVATNLGYFLTDRIFKERGLLTPPEVRVKDLNRVVLFNAQPSGVSFVSGTEVGSRTFDMDGVPVKSAACFSAGVDFSWFFNPYVAAECMVRASTGQAKAYSERSDEMSKYVFSGENIDIYHFDVAAKLSAPYLLSQRMGVRAIAGVRRMDALTFNGIERAPAAGSPALEKTLHTPARTSFELGCGYYMEAIDKENYAIGINVDYIHAFSPIMKNRWNIGSTWKILF